MAAKRTFHSLRHAWKQLAAATATLLAGGLVAKVLNLAAYPLIARLFSPAEFGLFVVFSSWSVLLGQVMGLRLHQGLMVAPRAHLPWLFSTSALLVALGTLLMVGVGPLAQWWQWTPATYGLLTVAAAATAWGLLLQAWLNRHEAYKQLAVMKVAERSAYVALAVGLGFFAASSTSLPLAYAAGHLVALAVGYGFARRQLGWKAPRLRSAFLRYGDFPAISLPVVLVNNAAAQLPIFLSFAWFGQALTGHLGMTWRLLAIPESLATLSLAQVFYQKLSRQAAEGGKLLPLVWGSQAWMALAALPVFGLLFWLAPTLFPWLLGDAWAAAGQLAPFACVYFLLMAVVHPTSYVATTLRRQSINLVFSVLSLAFTLLSFFLGYRADSLSVALVWLSVLEGSRLLAYGLVSLRLAHLHDRNLP